MSSGFGTGLPPTLGRIRPLPLPRLLLGRPFDCRLEGCCRFAGVFLKPAFQFLELFRMGFRQVVFLRGIIGKVEQLKLIMLALI